MPKRMYRDPTDLMNIKEGVLNGLTLTPPKKADKPTYEIVGPVERYDMRDYMYSRIALKQGTQQYDEYYARHPERMAIDDEMRKRADKSGKERLDKDAVNEHIALSGFYGTMAVSPPKVVNSFKKMPLHAPGRPDVVKLDLDPQLMSYKIKAFGLHLGAGKVGITRLNQDWVYTYTNTPYGQPVDLDYEYIICMAFPMDPFMAAGQNNLGENFEIGWEYSYASYISIIIANFIRNLGWRARPLPSFNAPYIVAPVFIDAGIGEYGRCGYVVSKEFGNMFRPSRVTNQLTLAFRISEKSAAFVLTYGPVGLYPRAKTRRWWYGGSEDGRWTRRSATCTGVPLGTAAAYVRPFVPGTIRTTCFITS